MSPELELVGRLVTASNATFVGRLCETEVVYKPVAGERPLWDFPDGTLAGREVATYLLSARYGWDVVPRTWLGEGPFGAGMLQEWISTDNDDETGLVDVVPTGEVQDGWLRAFDGYDALDQRVSVVHADLPTLRRVALFDMVVNNADRKGSHLLLDPDGAGAPRVLGVDHGLTFHVEEKLRTVLWGWQGEAFSDAEHALLAATREGLAGTGAEELSVHLSTAEVKALCARCDRLLAAGTFPVPPVDRAVVPWPPL